VTPKLAQQGGVLPYCQRQHDPKESCSKHVILATPKGKARASQKGGGDLRKLLIFSRLAIAGQRDLRNFAGRCRKFRSASYYDTAELADCTTVIRTP
jgi:hypothetical protein